MRRMSEKNETILKIVHVTSMSLWFSSLLIMFVISVSISKIISSETFYYAHKIISLIDFYILGPAAIVTFLTGIIYGKFTKWNIKKNKWIKIKVVLTVGIILLGTFWLAPTLHEMTNDAQEYGTKLLSNVTYLHKLKIFTIFSLINSLILLYAIIISSLKPGKQLE